MANHRLILKVIALIEKKSLSFLSLSVSCQYRMREQPGAKAIPRNPQDSSRICSNSREPA